MNILDKIIAHKRKEVAHQKELYPTKLLKESIFFDTPCVPMTDYIQREDKSGIIAEIKRKSPSKGNIHPYVSVEKTSIGYMQAGASALSVLTDTFFFGGKNDDLTLARRMNYCPILRKDFIIEEYQIVEARSIGADVILLIAAVLEPKQLERLASFAQSLGLQVLMEVHDEEELARSLNPHINLVGVNNRNLKTFEVNIQTAASLSPLIPDNFVKVAESGIKGPEEILFLEDCGYEGFLIGERFMKHAEPHKACAQFIDSLNLLKATKGGNPKLKKA
ncbi:MAG: indole-3-glycerol phosphate synthase TrpC [Bacteroidota bacterium]